MTQSSVLERARPRARQLTARAQATRQALLKAAERTFGRSSYEAASIADIVRRARVAQGTFYLYFPDKKAIFVELVRELGAQLRQALRAATAPCTTRLDVEREGLRAFLHFSRDHRDLYRIVRQCEFVDAKAYRAYYQSLADAYARGLEQAMTANELRAGDPERIAYFLMGIADFSGMRWILWDDAADLEAVVDEAITFIHRGLEPRPTPKERRR